MEIVQRKGRQQSQGKSTKKKYEDKKRRDDREGKDDRRGLINLNAKKRSERRDKRVDK